MKYFLIFLIVLGIDGCQDKMKEPVMSMKSDTFYTCSMHPQVMLDHPGKCPICGMELIAEKKGMGQEEESVVLSDQQIKLGGIRLDTVGTSKLGDMMLLSGTLSPDETRSSAVSGRITGRIERLYFKAAGEYIRKRDKLYDLYSEELNNAKQEYLLAMDRMETLKGGVIDLKQLAEAARNKLLLWGMTVDQVSELTRTRQVGVITSFYSPVSGYITALQSHEGDYMSAGTVVVRVADLSYVWVEAQVYTSQLPDLDRNGSVLVHFPDLPGKELTGKISLVNPEVDPDSRIGLIRVSLANPGRQLKPGMQAEVTVASGPRNSITLPQAAVLRTHGSGMVWVVSGHNSFRPVMVETGLEMGNRVEIRSGLNSGDIVVSEGTYLVNSEYVFRHGQNAMAGMKM